MLRQRLGGWTKIAVSAAERSWDGKRIRKFDADEIVAIGDVLGVPAIALLLPPADAGTAIDYVIVPGSAPVPPIDGVSLLAHLFPARSAAGTPVMDALLGRLAALTAPAALDAVGEELLRRAVARAAEDPQETGDAVSQRDEIEIARSRGTAPGGIGTRHPGHPGSEGGSPSTGRSPPRKQPRKPSPPRWPGSAPVAAPTTGPCSPGTTSTTTPRARST